MLIKASGIISHNTNIHRIIYIFYYTAKQLPLWNGAFINLLYIPYSVSSLILTSFSLWSGLCLPVVVTLQISSKLSYFLFAFNDLPFQLFLLSGSLFSACYPSGSELKYDAVFPYFKIMAAGFQRARSASLSSLPSSQTTIFIVFPQFYILFHQKLYRIMGFPIKRHCTKLPFIAPNDYNVLPAYSAISPWLWKRQTAAYGFTPYVPVVFRTFCHPRDFKLLRYSAISSSLTVSKICCSSLTTKSRSFGR